MTDCPAIDPKLTRSPLTKGMVEMWSPIPYNASLVDRVDILVSPRHSKHVKQYLNCAGMNVDVIEENLQKAIDEENSIDDQEVIISKKTNPTTTPTFLDTHMISKRGTSFGDFLRGLFVEVDTIPEAVREGRQSRPTSLPPGKCSYTGMNWNKYHRYSTIDNFVRC